MRSPRQVSIDWTHEDESGLDIEFRVTATACPPEPRTWDYPGSPATMEDIEGTAVAVVEIDGSKRTPRKSEAKHWNGWIAEQIESDSAVCSEIITALFEAANND